MIPAVLAFLLLQVGAQATGAVTGVVRSPAGTAAGVRVYAQQVRDSADANSPAAPLEGQAQTEDRADIDWNFRQAGTTSRPVLSRPRRITPARRISRRRNSSW